LIQAVKEQARLRSGQTINYTGTPYRVNAHKGFFEAPGTVLSPPQGGISTVKEALL
jgi:hypothetical protein